MKIILEVKNITKKIAKKDILKNVSFSVVPGEIYGFLGPNGAGKTTVMKCIMGLIEPEKGEINIFGTPGLSREDKKKIGFMPENTYLYKHLTGVEFLKFNAIFFDIRGKELDILIKNMLKKIGLSDFGDRLLHTYSKGMLQRIGLGQALIHEPELLFLDEPMSGLDPIGRKMVKDLLVELHTKGTTIFFNTHILADVESICNRITIINKGIILVEGKKISDINGNLENYFIDVIENDSA